MTAILFVLVASSSDAALGRQAGTQVLSYHNSNQACQARLLQVEKTVDRGYVRLDCVSRKAPE